MAFYLQPEYPGNTLWNSCFFCKSSRRQDEQVVTTDREVELIERDAGMIVFCETCALEIGHLVGLTDPAASRTKITKLSDELAETTEALEDMRDTLRNVLTTVQLINPSSAE